MNPKWFAIGLGVGATVGAVAAILCTPKTGAEMREMLKDGASDLRRYAAGKVKEEHYTIGDVINEIDEGNEGVNREEKSAEFMF